MVPSPRLVASSLVSSRQETLSTLEETTKTSATESMKKWAVESIQYEPFYATTQSTLKKEVRGKMTSFGGGYETMLTF